METYRINGQEIEFDTFDLVNLELFDSEVKRLAAIDRQKAPTDFSYMREMCEGIRDFFDTLCGEGTAEKCFGNRMNARELLDAYAGFVQDIQSTVQAYQSSYDGFGGPAEAPVNREQRRAMERQKRRQEARERAEKRQERVKELEA